MPPVDLAALHRSLQTASKQRRITFWTRFCLDHEIAERAVPLFALSGDHVSVQPYGLDQRLILQRSPQMESLVINEVQKVVQDFSARTEEFEGLIYMMLWKDDNLILPLYSNPKVVVNHSKR